MKKFTWTVVVTYMTREGKLDVAYDLVDIGNLKSIIENGPDFDTIEGVVLVRVNKARAVTIEDVIRSP